MNDASSPDPDACAREPIRIPGAIQPHGVLLAFSHDGRHLLQASTNAAAELRDPLDRHRSEGLFAFPASVAGQLASWAVGASPTLVFTDEIDDRRWQFLAHRSAQGLILELEAASPDEPKAQDLYTRLQDVLQGFADARSIGELCRAAVIQTRLLTGFDRVLLYRFEEDWSGVVIAEEGNGKLPSYSGLRFPASDIPQQARELYKLNRLRLIANVNYDPVRIEPALSPVDDLPLDLSFAALRSVSPVHLQYMRNMGTFASMSVSILVDDRLWGLISCHNVEPRRVGPPTRAACDLLGRNLGLQIASRQRDIDASQRVELKRRESSLLATLTASGDLASGLSEAGDLWRSLIDADGVAILIGDTITAAGRCPDETSIRRLANWAQQRATDGIFATHSLAGEWEGGLAIKDEASGVIAAAISQLHADLIFWFRGEIVHTVEWAGDPTKPMQPSPKNLSPRTSFENWKEQVRLQSRQWTPAEIDAARDFRNAVTIFVLRRAEERAALTEQLQRSNRELEAFSYSISHDLRAPFRHIAGYAELLSSRNRHLDDKSQHYLTSIIEAALSAGRLVDDLLHFSQLGRATLSRAQVDVVKLVDEARRSLVLQSENRQIEWRVGSLPPAYGDASMLRQAFLNLIDNAVKYTRGREPAIIEISGESRSDETIYRVSDNGVGFEMAYVGKLFGVFQRLHRAEEFEGTGIGLALTKRILERHGGWIEARSVLGERTTFTLGLPIRREGAR